MTRLLGEIIDSVIDRLDIWAVNEPYKVRNFVKSHV